MRVKITPIQSNLPGWYDPDVPGFSPPQNWKDCRIRLRVLINKDPAGELKRARESLQRKYPGAVLQLMPEYANATPPEFVEAGGSDAAVIERYFRLAELPEGVTVEQLCTHLKQYLSSTGAFGVQGVKFLNVTAQNVLCFEDVKLDLNRKGLTLITGRNLDWGENTSNGSGKSSLTCLPFLAMFGRTFKGQTHDAWGRKDSKDCTIKLNIELTDKSHLQILRTRKPASLHVFRDGEEVTMGDANQTQALIESLTNLTWSVLTNAVYIGQNEVGSVFGTEKERKELFSRLLGLDRFLDAQTKLAKKVLRQQRAVEETEAESIIAGAALREAQSSELALHAALAAIPEESEKDERIRNLEINELERQVLRRETENKDLSEQLDENQKSYWETLSLRQDVESRCDIIKQQIEASLDIKDSVWNCPTCGSKTSPVQIGNHVTHLKTDLAVKEKTYQTYTCAMARNRTVRDALQSKYVKNNTENQQDVPRIQNLREEKVRRQGQAEHRRNLQDVINGKRERRGYLNRCLSVHLAACEAYREEKQFLEICARAVGRDGIPAYLCTVVIPQLNTAAMRYSEIFTNGEIGIRFSASSGDVDIEVINIHGGDGIKDQSQGEMRMAGLIAAFAFRDVLVPHNLLILDEPGEGLDAANATAFAQGLNKIVERFQHVIVISHNERILAEIEPDFRIEVTKQDQVSEARLV